MCDLKSPQVLHNEASATVFLADVFLIVFRRQPQSTVRKSKLLSEQTVLLKPN